MSQGRERRVQHLVDRGGARREVVGRGGAEEHVEIELWPKEKLGLQKSGKALKETLSNVNV